jgi:hypothetical protein
VCRPGARRGEVTGRLGIAQAQHQPRRDRQSRCDMQQFESVGEDLVLLSHLRWPLVGPCLDQDRQLVIGAVDLNAHAIVQDDPARTERDPEPVSQPGQYDLLGVALFTLSPAGPVSPLFFDARLIAASTVITLRAHPAGPQLGVSGQTHRS